MRKDLGKVLTEKPRHGSDNRNVKTGFHENGFDDRERTEDKYSMPKTGKMLMRGRHIGYDLRKDFTDVLGPLQKWAYAQVGRHWDKVYSEIRKTLPNNNLQNHHIIDTHLLGYFNKDVEVVKTKKGRRVYNRVRASRYGGELNELWKGDLYVDPATKVIMRYKGGKDRSYSFSRKPAITETGYSYMRADNYGPMTYDKVYLGPNEQLEKRGLTWVYCKYEKVEVYIGEKLSHTYLDLTKHHTLSKKELQKYGLRNPTEEEIKDEEAKRLASKRPSYY